MEYNKIVAVGGLPGLYELISSKNDGAVIRSLEDKTTRFASSRIHNFSHLESIEIYTTGDNVNLVEIFNAIENAGTALPDSKDNDAVKKYFEEIYPDLDFEKVYTSDLKKMVKWYEVLKKHDIEIKLTEPAEEEEPETEEVKEELVVVADAPKKPAAKKTTAAAAKEKAKDEKEKPKAEKSKETKAAKEEPKKKAPVKAKKESAAKEKPKAEKPKTEKKKDDKSSSVTKKKK